MWWPEITIDVEWPLNKNQFNYDAANTGKDKQYMYLKLKEFELIMLETKFHSTSRNVELVVKMLLIS